MSTLNHPGTLVDRLRGPGFGRLLALLISGIGILTGWAQSSRPGMGATPYADSGGGVTFRVWAPNATNVAVRGSFNGWGQTPMVNEGASGNWSVDVPGATAGSQYKFYLNNSIWKKDPRGRQVVHSQDNSIVYDPNAFNWNGDTRLGANESDLVIYEMHVGAFHDPSPWPINNLPGKFGDAIAKLDHLQDLGVNAVELLPIWEFPGDYSWGYNPSDPYAVENFGYGGPDGLKAFVKAAHDRGISVLLDVVHNHYGPSDLDLWGFDNGATPGIYFYSGALGQTGWGDTRPNYSAEGVRSYIIDNFNMWMDEYHVDGFRWDSVGTMRFYSGGSVPGADTLIQYINNTEIRANRPGVISIAEDQAYGQGFHGEWDTGFWGVLVDQASKANDVDRNMFTLWGEIGGSSFFNVIFAENHDKVGALNGADHQRLPKRIDSGNPESYWARKRSMLASAVLMTTPGIPMLFMGQEMLETNQFSDSKPLDWNRTITQSGVVNFHRDMIHLRRNLDGVSLGLTGPSVTQQHINDGAKVLAYHRWGAGANDQVMVIMNWSATSFGSYNLNFPENGRWYVNLNSDWTRYGSDFGNFGSLTVDVAGNSGTVAIAPYSVLILSRQAHPELDSDADGLLNGWEQEHFGDPLVAVATNDFDLDGADNLAEQGADTDPKSADSVLKLLSAGMSGGNLTLKWKGGVNARQVLQKATTVTGTWTPIFTNHPPTPLTNSLVLAAPDAQSYFRISAGP